MSPHAAVYDAWQTAWAYADSLTASHAGATLWREQRARRLAALLRHAAQGSRFYRQRLQAAGHDANADDSAEATLLRVKPVRKRELMKRFDDWVTDPALTLPALRSFVRDRKRRGEAFQGRYLVWESSGSSGEPALFVQDEHAMAVADAIEAARGPISLAGGSGAWPDLWGANAWTSQRIALVAALDGHFASVVAFERARELNPWLGSHSRSFSFLQPIEQLVAQLNAFAPSVLATYPSMAWVLAEQQRAGRLHIEPHAVWTGGETLTPAMRRTLGERFHAPVRDSYGASECFLIANECRCGRLHLNADWVILKPVDTRGRAVPPGRYGATTLLTNLANHVQPIIRYDLGDRVRFATAACACGSTLPVIDVQGRADDVLTLEDDSGHAVHLAPLALTTVLEDKGGVFDFQLRRRGPHALELELHDAAAAADHGAGARSALRAFLREQGLAGTRVQCRCDGQPAVRGRSGKQRRVVCDAHEAHAAHATAAIRTEPGNGS